MRPKFDNLGPHTSCRQEISRARTSPKVSFQQKYRLVAAAFELDVGNQNSVRMSPIINPHSKWMMLNTGDGYDCLVYLR